jgi:hypothetical protein
MVGTDRRGPDKANPASIKESGIHAGLRTDDERVRITDNPGVEFAGFDGDDLAKPSEGFVDERNIPIDYDPQAAFTLWTHGASG